MSILAPQSFECFSHGEEQTERIGMRLGELIAPGAVLALSGALGAGKTHFARGVGMGWGARQELRSPTFTMVQEHRRSMDKAGSANQRLYHIDLYRIESAAGLSSLGLHELLDDGEAIVMIEWPERAPGMLPARAMRIGLQALSETRRQLLFATDDAASWQLLLMLRKRVLGA